MANTNKLTSATIIGAIDALIDGYYWRSSDALSVSLTSVTNAAELALMCECACQNPYTNVYVTLGTTSDGRISLEAHDVDTQKGVGSLIGSALLLADGFCDDSFEVWAFVPAYDREAREWEYTFERVPLR